MNQLYGNEPAPARFNTQKYLQGGRVGFGDGGITLITQGPNKGKYHLRLGGGKEGRQTYYGTKDELQKIFNERPKPGGDRFLRLEAKKYDKNWLTKKQFLKFLSDNNIKAETAPSFSKNHGIKTKVNPLQKNTYLYNISQLTPEKINTIQKKQVKVGQGTDIARKKFPPIPQQHFVEKRATDIKEEGGIKKGGIFEGSRSIHKGHLRDYKKSLITGETLAYTPEKINVKMGRALEHKIRRVTEKIEKIKKQKLPVAAKKKLLEELDAKLIRLAEQSTGYKQVVLSSGNIYGGGRPTVDPLNMFPGRTEQQINDFVKKYKNKKAVPGVTPKSEIDNIVKANIFEQNRQATFEAAKARAPEDVKKFRNQLNKGAVNFAKKIEGTEIARKICSAKANGGVAGCVKFAQKNPARFMSRAFALGLAGELAFELAAAAPGLAAGKTGSELLGESIFGIFGAGTTFNEELAKYADPDAKELIDLQEDIAQLEKTGSTIGALEAGLEGETELQKRMTPGYLKEAEGAVERLSVFKDPVKTAAYAKAMEKYLAAQKERSKSLPRQAVGQVVETIKAPFIEGIKDVGQSPGLFKKGGKVDYDNYLPDVDKIDDDK
jgi:hypothetical protein